MPSVSLKFLRPYRTWKAGEVVPIINGAAQSKPGEPTPVMRSHVQSIIGRGFAEYANAKPKSKRRKPAGGTSVESPAGEGTSADQPTADGNEVG